MRTGNKHGALIWRGSLKSKCRVTQLTYSCWAQSLTFPPQCHMYSVSLKAKSVDALAFLLFLCLVCFLFFFANPCILCKFPCLLSFWACRQSMLHAWVIIIFLLGSWCTTIYHWLKDRSKVATFCVKKNTDAAGFRLEMESWADFCTHPEFFLTKWNNFHSVFSFFFLFLAFLANSAFFLWPGFYASAHCGS